MNLTEDVAARRVRTVEPDEPDALERDDNPHSVLGQLQLGRGAGWLRAASEGDGPELLRAALSREPRWDRQLEHRADYYATLAIALGLSSLDLDLDEICLDEDARQLGLAVFGRLAVRGDDAAIAVLQQEFSRPENDPTTTGCSARCSLPYALARDWWDCARCSFARVKTPSSPTSSRPRASFPGPSGR